MKILIIGQGIAGTCMAWQAIQAGMEVTVIDECLPHNASTVSSGIINPITGRSFVKSWKIEEFTAAAVEMYTAMGEKSGREFIRPIPINRHIPNIETENIWSSRALDNEYEDYILSEMLPGGHYTYLNGANKFGTVQKGYQVFCSDLIHAFRTKWKEEGRLHESVFIEYELQCDESNIEYAGTSYDAVVLSTGWKGKDSKLFPSEDYRPFKGEVLICRIPELSSMAIIKFEKFFVPLGGDLFWVGSNNQRNFKNEKPDPFRVQELHEYLNNRFSLSYEIVDHIAGIRPATKFRRPFIGSHSRYPRLWLFNGLGTKGISMAPYWSQIIVDKINKGDFNNPMGLTQGFIKSFYKKGNQSVTGAQLD